MASSSLAQLTSWLRYVGIWWDESLVQIHGGCSNCSGLALGVVAVSDIHENQLLCVIPRSAILSPRTTQLAQILEDEKLGGGLALTIAVMYEASLGQGSTWAGYFASLPRREYLPMFWSDEELQLLAGTALDGVAEDDRRDTEEDYQQHVVPLMERHLEAFPHPELCSLEHFRTAASWVASRSFHVDSWHGDAMVPLADIFNHKASLVLLEDSWQVAEEVDRQQQQHHDQHEREQLEAGSEGQQDDEHAMAEDNLGEESSDDASQNEDSGDDSEQSNAEDKESEEDPQHGFAVGGMPLIAAGTAVAATGGIVHKAAGCWVRDGINLRLEIGICSVGEPDTALASLAAPVAAAAAAKTKPDSAAAGQQQQQQAIACMHQRDQQWGSGNHEDTDGAPPARSQQHKRHSKAQPQQQQKRQKISEAGHGQQVTNRRGQQQQQQQQPTAAFPDKRLEIVAASPVPAGAEVHNTYGELSNQALVHKYGFCLPANPFDEVQLGPSWEWLLTDVVQQAGLGKKLKQHMQWLQKNSHLLPGSDDGAEAEGGEAEDPPAVLPGGRLPLLVAAVVRLLGAPASKLKEWDSLHDLLDTQQQQWQPQQHSKPGRTQQEKIGKDVASTMAGAAGDSAAAEQALAEHFDDVEIASRDAAWWGKTGLELLQRSVTLRLQQYPSKSLSIDEDQQASAELQSNAQKQQQQLVSEQNRQQEISKQGGDAAEAADVAGTREHAAAVAAGLQLRMCEQRILKQVLDAIKQVLGDGS